MRDGFSGTTSGGPSPIGIDPRRDGDILEQVAESLIVALKAAEAIGDQKLIDSVRLSLFRAGRLIARG